MTDSRRSLSRRGYVLAVMGALALTMLPGVTTCHTADCPAVDVDGNPLTAPCLQCSVPGTVPCMDNVWYLPDGATCLDAQRPVHEDGTPCDSGNGVCQVGVCELSRFPCTEQGILDAIAAGGGPHFFDCAGPTTVTTQSRIVVDNDVVLDGEGELTLDGNDQHVVFIVESGVTAALRGFTVTGGGEPADIDIAGGGIFNMGTLTLTRMMITGNDAVDNHGGGVYNVGALVLQDSIVSGNNASYHGQGGGIFTNGTSLSVIRSTISNNWAGSSGGGICQLYGDLTIADSTVSGNIALNAWGGGIMVVKSDLTLINSTVSGNSAVHAGGGISTHDSSGTANSTLVNTTVSGNTVSYPGTLGSAISHEGTLGSVQLISSVLDGDCWFSDITPSATYTIESPGSTCSLPSGQGNQMNVSAGALSLGPLQDNGGTTFTRAPLTGSLAIDAVSLVSCVDQGGAAMVTDQRGMGRPVNLICDAGSVEGHCLDCSDSDECTVDACNSSTQLCSNLTAPDGTRCDGADGMCIAGLCHPDRRWGAPELIETNDDPSARGVDIAMNWRGDVVAVWMQPDAYRNNIWANHYTLADGWGTAELIESGDGDAGSPEVTIRSDGKAIAVWRQTNFTRYGIWANIYTPWESGWETPQLIENNSGSAGYARIYMDRIGRAFVVWHQSDGVRNNIWSNLYSPGTGGQGSWGTPVLLETGDGEAFDPQIVADDNKNAIALWRQQDGARWDIWSNRHAPIAGWGTAELVETNDVGDALGARAAIDPDGNVMAVWVAEVGWRSDVWATIHTPTGGWGTPVLIEHDDAGDTGAAEVAMDAQGRALVVWDQSDGSDFNAYSARYTPTSGWETPVLLETNPGTAFGPKIAMNADGDALVVWYQDDDGTYGNLWSNRYTPATGWGSAELIETNDGDAKAPDVAMDVRTRAVVAWDQTDGTERSIWSSEFR